MYVITQIKPDLSTNSEQWTVVRVSQPLFFQQYIRIVGPIQRSMGGTKHLRNYTYRNAYAHTYTHNPTQHTHMTVYTISAITVAGLNIIRCARYWVCYYDVHTLYVECSIPCRMDSAISQYCSRILSNIYRNWPAVSSSEPAFTFVSECIALYFMLIPIGVYSK